ncbi:unnamed protein product, partial [Iphiclides podalirius]
MNRSNADLEQDSQIMTYARLYFIFALIYTARCNPLGQATVCESAQAYPNSATVCESASNLPYYPYGLPSGLGVAGVLPAFSSPLGLPGLLNPALGSTTVCESAPNTVGLGGLGLNPLYGLPLGLPYGIGGGIPNLLGVGTLGVPYPGVPVVGGGSSTVCESSPNLLGLGALGLPLQLGGLGLGGLGLGLAHAAVPLL